MERKLKKLLKNKISQQFVAELENKLTHQFKPQSKSFFFNRYSFVGAALMVLLVVTVVVTAPFSTKNNIVANALEIYKSLQDESGIFYVKEKVTITGNDGVESEFGNEYVSEIWHGDNGEFIFKGTGKKDATYLTTADGRLFTNDNVDGRRTEEWIYCVVYKDRIDKDDIMGRVFLDVKADDYSQYEVASGLVGYKEEDDLPVELLPEDRWREDGRLPKNVLEEIKENGDYEVEEFILDGKEVYKISAENNDEVSEMYFEKESLVLRKAVYYPAETWWGHESTFRMTIEYLEVKNITDVSGKEFFAPSEDMKQYYEGPGFISQVGCYSSYDSKLSDDEMNELLKNMPESAKGEIEKAKNQIERALEIYPERLWE